MKKIFQRILIWVAALGLVVYFAFQGTSVFLPKVRVEQALLYTAYDDVTATGYIVREEEIIAKPGSEIYDVSASDGMRVKKNGVIATVYESAAQAEASAKIKDYNQRITVLEESEVVTVMGSNEIIKLEQNIMAAVSQIAASGKSGDGAAAQKAKEELTILLNQKSVMLGEISGFGDIIKELKTERDELSAQSGGGISSVKTSKSGSFVAFADGFESVLSPGILKDLKCEGLDEIIKSAPKINGDDILGKIVTGFGWYFAAPMKNSGLSEGDLVRLRFPFAPGETIPAEVEYVNGDGTEQLVVLFSNYELPELNLVRNQTVQIVKSSISGLKVRKAAMHVIDGASGVFVRSGDVLKWKPCDVKFDKDDYYLIPYEKEKKNALMLYDLVVYEGRNLYDGKVV